MRLYCLSRLVCYIDTQIDMLIVFNLNLCLIHSMSFHHNRNEKDKKKIKSYSTSKIFTTFPLLYVITICAPYNKTNKLTKQNLHLTKYSITHFCVWSDFSTFSVGKSSFFFSLFHCSLCELFTQIK